VHALQQSLWRAVVLALASASLVALAAGVAQAVRVTPVNGVATSANIAAVRFVTNSASPQTLTCEVATVRNTIPNERTNPNSGGSVITEIWSTSSTYVAAFSECAIGGTRLSGGASDVMTFAWNIIESEDLIAIGLPMPAFTFNDNSGCRITIGNFDVQSMIGVWTDGSPTSRMRITEQAMLGEATSQCRLGTFTRFLFTGTFEVSELATRTPVILEGP